MRYWIRTIAGLSIAGGSLVAFNWGLYHLMRTGTCASGGPFEIARPCPPGTGGHVLALVGGIFGGIAGAGVYATRGPGGVPGRLGLGSVLWALLFVSISATALVAAFGPAAPDANDLEIMAIVLAVVFTPMGLAPLPLALAGGRRQALAQRLLATGRRATGTVVSVEDTGVTVNDDPRVRMKIRAEPPGEAPFEFDKTTLVPRVRIPRAGDRCTVFYDPDDHSKVGITFDPVPGMETPAAAAATAPAAAAGEGDVVTRLERLAALREKGLLTQAEFDEQKQRLLDEI